MSFQQKVALITGGTMGIGAAVADRLHQLGARVVIVSRSRDDTESKAAALSLDGKTALGLACDVSRSKQVCRLIEDIIAHYGRLDFAVNSAGTSGEHNKPVPEQTVENWDSVIANTLSSVFYCMKYQLPAIEKSGGGAIVNLSAVNGVVGIPGIAPYTVAKHGVIGLTQTAALGFATKGIRINAVAPGYVSTPRNSALPATVGAAFAASHPVQRMASVTEVAEFIVFLLSDNASFCTGGVYPIDGGYLAQ